MVPVDISKPHCDQNGARIAIGTESGIFGLIVPSDNDSAPSYERISNLELSPLYNSCLGIDKIYSHKGSGVVRVASYTWPDAGNSCRDDSLLPASSTGLGWREWKFKHWWMLFPRLDERSNRVITLAKRGWVMVDFAHK